MIIKEKSPMIFRHLPCFLFLSLATSVSFSSFKLNKIVMFESFLLIKIGKIGNKNIFIKRTSFFEFRSQNIGLWKKSFLGFRCWEIPRIFPFFLIFYLQMWKIKTFIEKFGIIIIKGSCSYFKFSFSAALKIKIL